MTFAFGNILQQLLSHLQKFLSHTLFLKYIQSVKQKMGGVVSSSEKGVDGLHTITYDNGPIDSGYIRFETPGATILDLNEDEKAKIMESDDVVKKLRSGTFHFLSGMNFEFEKGSKNKVKAVYIKRTNSSFETDDGTKSILGLLRVLYMSTDELSKMAKDFDENNAQVSFYKPEFRLKFDMPTNKDVVVDPERKKILSLYSPPEMPTSSTPPAGSGSDKKGNQIWITAIVVMFLILMFGFAYHSIFSNRYKARND